MQKAIVLGEVAFGFEPSLIKYYRIYLAIIEHDVLNNFNLWCKPR